jgi:hypothetical protein
MPVNWAAVFPAKAGIQEEPRQRRHEFFRAAALRGLDSRLRGKDGGKVGIGALISRYLLAKENDNA